MHLLRPPLASFMLCAIGLVVPGVIQARPQDKTARPPRSSHRQEKSVTKGRLEAAARAAQRKKIEINLNQLDAEGLRGPDGGKVAVSYEFCIPDTKRCRAEVKRIDVTVQFMPGSAGRIGAKKGQCLCIGSTHQAHWRAVLNQLAALPYVRRIIEAHFE